MISDEKLVREAQTERRIKNTDFESDLVRGISYKFKNHYTVYSRGGIRVYAGSSDALKFDPKTETGVNLACD